MPPAAGQGTLAAVSPILAALIALQKLDSAADAARKRLAELPAAEQTIAASIAAGRAAVDAVLARLKANQDARRGLEKEVAAVDTRLARFDDHKAAVKTNQEYTALLHEIATAKSEKTGIEERILELMVEADGLAVEQKAAEAALARTTADGTTARAGLAAERAALEAEVARLSGERQQEARAIDPPVLARYEQVLKQRRGVAIARMTGEICEACHVRLRPHVAQQIRRNETIVPCESCQRILYYDPPPAGVTEPS